MPIKPLAACVLAVAAVLAGAPVALAALDAPAAVARLNAVRAANGIPGNLTVDPELSRGCVLHTIYMRTGSNYRQGPDFAPHRELPGEPNASELGNRAAGVSQLFHGYDAAARERAFRTDPTEIFWNDAPLHMRGLLNPWATTAWWGGDGSYGCMGVSGGLDSLPRFPGEQPPPGAAFYSFPGDGVSGVPVATVVRGEWPFNPATKVGLPIGTLMGPTVYLFSRDLASLVDATVTGPAGPVPVRVERNGAFVFFPSPLKPLATYVVRAAWDVDAFGDGNVTRTEQSFTFATGANARLDDEVWDPGITVRARRVGRVVTFRISAGKALGQRVTVSVNQPVRPFAVMRRMTLTRPVTILRTRISRSAWKGSWVAVRVFAHFRREGIPYSNRLVGGAYGTVNWRP